jgi:hypothetical protein
LLCAEPCVGAVAERERGEDAFSRSINSDAWAEAEADVVNVFDGSMLWGARLQERVVKAGKELVAP